MGQRPGTYVLLTPVRNEAATLDRTVASVAAQRHPPARWILVDDGSSDGTGEIAERAARELPFARAVHRPDRGFDDVGAGIVDALNAGLGALSGETARYLGTLDGDVEVDADYFARLVERMDDDPDLGIASGQSYVRRGDGTLAGERFARFHPVGAARLYRWRTFSEIGGLVASPGWDSLDVLRAQRLGYRTRCFADLRALHLRPMGTRGSLRQAVLLQGRVSYLLGYSPLYFAARLAAHALRRPLLRRSGWLLQGYLRARRSDEPRIATVEEARWLRRFQLRRLLGLGPPPADDGRALAGKG